MHISPYAPKYLVVEENTTHHYIQLLEERGKKVADGGDVLIYTAANLSEVSLHSLFHPMINECEVEGPPWPVVAASAAVCV